MTTNSDRSRHDASKRGASKIDAQVVSELKAMLWNYNQHHPALFVRFVEAKNCFLKYNRGQDGRSKAMRKVAELLRAKSLEAMATEKVEIAPSQVGLESQEGRGGSVILWINRPYQGARSKSDSAATSPSILAQQSRQLFDGKDLEDYLAIIKETILNRWPNYGKVLEVGDVDPALMAKLKTAKWTCISAEASRSFEPRP